jgi:hypothetical protein
MAKGRDLAVERLVFMHGGVENVRVAEVDGEIGIPEPPTVGDDVPHCLGGSDFNPCRASAGKGTLHPGFGKCARHERGVEKAAGAWMMAHFIANVLDISPWEALLLAVRRAATWAAFYEKKIGEVDEGNDDSLRPGGSHYDWVLALERTTEKMARFSKMAVDAGVAQMLVSRARAEGELIARALNAALGVVDLSPEQEALMRGALRKELLALETATIIDGELTGA